MYLSKISLTGFKNYDSGEFELSEGINIFYGPNGAGKTNLLDAVHYLSTCKSFLVSSDILNIKNGTDFFLVEGWLSSEKEENVHLQCAVKKGQGKIIRKNKKEYEKLSDHIGFMPVVVMAPNDQELLFGGSAERRKFIDSLISSYDRLYLDHLIAYSRLIEQRNAFLKQCKDSGVFRGDLLDIYDMQLVPHADYIHEARENLAKEIFPLFYEMYAHLSQTDEMPAIVQKSDMTGNSDTMVLYINAREKDKVLLYTSVGPHKDDFEFYLSGRPVKSSTSQGQQKTFLSALKLARFIFIKNKTGKTPLLLLDDIFDKLDENRVQNLISIVSQKPFGQVLITDTGKNRVSRLIKNTDRSFVEFELQYQTRNHEQYV